MPRYERQVRAYLRESRLPLVSARARATIVDRHSPITNRNITVDGEIRSRHTANAILKKGGHRQEVLAGHVWRPHGAAGERLLGDRATGASWPVSRVLSGAEAPRRPFIWDGDCSRASSNQPGRRPGSRLDAGVASHARAAPIRSCSRWGLPCRPCCQGRGALLPHRFTLALARSPPRGRSLLCGTFPGVAPGGR